ncbi:F0F1 ATP synthase subunit A [Streptococcus gallolyticus]|uniref:ATP synthase subunit a n=1 Tax=Streptococcus gallolyticus TaxID=315405 RepID=A0A368UD04_9STRE|nr:F0F1 ATP synthase subunit A [Streptococcus gallolyticus]RCW16847.1 F0F1 ATP synthase subunit A [Streptococcus gallolyticus]
METTVNPTVHFLGIDFDLTILLMSLLTVLIAFSIIFAFSRHMTLKPKGKQNILEWVYEFVQGIITPNLGRYASHYSLFFFGLFFFLLVANNIGLVTKLEVGKYNLWSSPTATAAYNFGLSLIVAVVVHVEGIRKNGLKGYLKEYLEPVPAMLPMNILEEFTNIISLTLRLYGNIFAGEIILGLLVTFAHINIVAWPVAVILNILWTGFSIMISCIQAYVFVILSSVYIGKKVNHEE